MRCLSLSVYMTEFWDVTKYTHNRALKFDVQHNLIPNPHPQSHEWSRTRSHDCGSSVSLSSLERAPPRCHSGRIAVVSPDYSAPQTHYRLLQTKDAAAVISKRKVSDIRTLQGTWSSVLQLMSWRTKVNDVKGDAAKFVNGHCQNWRHHTLDVNHWLLNFMIIIAWCYHAIRSDTSSDCMTTDGDWHCGGCKTSAGVLYSGLLHLVRLAELYSWQWVLQRPQATWC